MQALYSDDEKSFYMERLELSNGRIKEISAENILQEPFGRYFRDEAEFIDNPAYDYGAVDKYEKSWLNPVYAVNEMGREKGRMLSFLAYELFSLMAYKAEGKIYDELILKELFIEVYNLFTSAKEEENGLPEDGSVHSALYSFVSDYSDHTVRERIVEQLDPDRSFARDIIMESDLTDLSYLDRFGEYIDEDVKGVARHLLTFTDAEIKAMADTFTEGFRIGFINTGKDLSKKKTVSIRYKLGFERIVRAAVENFEAMGLKTTIYRRALNAGSRSGMSLVGFYGGRINKQMEFDHREDNALFLDKAYITRKLEVMRTSYEELKDKAAVFAGPAVMDIYGEEPFLPESHPEAYELSEEQQKLSINLMAKTGSLVNEYIRGDERSFTIISYPIPSIGKDFKAIFDETVKLNTLDYEKYKLMQQKIIDVLENGSKVEVKGRGNNKTDITVALHELDDRKKQTVFENCVADVNIPVGEVFTSPKLNGTNGTLFVSEVYLNGLRYENLEFKFENGFVKDYNCTNFDSEDKNKKYIKDNILHHYDSLPLGEFAVGTNTTAYAMARRYNIFSKLEILIAEKTGPHFALGDTCYSRAEDIKVFNPDGREIISKDNESTLKRKTDSDFRYFECHTDVTIPYEELGTITAVDEEGNRYPIIKDGRFVVEGTEELNEPLDKLSL
ncbi:MAG: aminopeptidase [Lachnospiraceae bacterium]|nr:aminopeptidase [Lachnospiraceae bacterium]